MTDKSSRIPLHNGVQISSLGLGALDRSALDQIAGAVEVAIKAGYRLVDTAAAYNSERQVGK